MILNKYLRVLFFALYFLNLNLLPQECFSCDAYDLVNHFRFDIMAKYIYAKSRELGVSSTWPLEVYSQHLKVWGNFIEYGGKDKPPQKVGLDAYLRDFHEVLDSVKSTGFENSKSFVPVGYESISNGSHRVTACLLYNKPVFCKKVKFKGVEATADFFKKRKIFVKDGLEEKYLDAMALQYCGLKKSSVIALLFDSWQVENFKKTISKYGHVVYEKSVLLLPNGLKNINNILKLECLQHQIFVFLLDFDALSRKKNNNLFWDNQSVYITGSQSDALILAQTFFSKNSLDLINQSDAETILHLNQFADKCKNVVEIQKLNSEVVCFLYDKHNLNNVKFISHKPLDPIGDEIIFNPQNFFYFKGIKFAVKDNFKSEKLSVSDFRFI